MRLGSGGNGGGDGRQIDGVAAKDRDNAAHDAGRDKLRGRGNIVAIGLHHRDAGQVLRRHGDDKERQGDAEEGIERKDRQNGNEGAGRLPSSAPGGSSVVSASTTMVTSTASGTA